MDLGQMANKNGRIEPQRQNCHVTGQRFGTRLACGSHKYVRHVSAILSGLVSDVSLALRAASLEQPGRRSDGRRPSGMLWK